MSIVTIWSVFLNPVTYGFYIYRRVSNTFSHTTNLYIQHTFIYTTHKHAHAHGHIYGHRQAYTHTETDTYTDYGYLSIFVSSTLTLWPPYVWPHKHKKQNSVINLCLPENKLEVLTSYLHVLDPSATSP